MAEGLKIGAISGAFAGAFGGYKEFNNPADPGRGPANINGNKKSLWRRFLDKFDKFDTHLDRQTCVIFTDRAWDPRCGDWTDNLKTFTWDRAMSWF